MPELSNSPDNSSATTQYDAEQVQDLIIKKRLSGFSRKKKLLGVLGVVILIALGTGFYFWRGIADKQDGFLTARVAKATITDYIEATGTLEPLMKSEMGFKNDGTIILLNVQPGNLVARGDILARQDSTTLKSALDQANSLVAQDEISLEMAIMNRDSNRKTMEQQERLFEAGVSAEVELDSARNNFRKSELEVMTAEAKLANDKAKVEESASDLNDATLVAPFDGIIGQVNGQVGQLNGINASSSTLLTVMSKELQLSALVNEADIGWIEIGQEVEFTSNAYSDKVFQGKVLRITPEAESVSSVQYYPVLISCLDPDGHLYSGMSVSAKIIVTREDDVLTVPMMAVSFAETYARNNPESGGGQGAMNRTSRTGSQNKNTEGISPDPSNGGQSAKVLVLQNNQATIKPVVLGVSNGSIYRVISGLNEGEAVIIGSSRVDGLPSSSTVRSGNSGYSNSGRNRQIQSGGGMPGGGPPPGF